MTSTSEIRNKVINQIMAIKDAEFLRALSDMIDRARMCRRKLFGLPMNKSLC